MLTLNDGRKELYQWDTGRAATVDIDCDIVHFANLKYGESLAVEVKEGKVSIPNKLLMSGEPIYCWAFVKDDNGAYTKKEQTISVTKRAKPSDYVYTETEAITIKTAVENALEKAKESGDFKGDKGDKGDDGYTPQKGVDYFTEEDIAGLNIPSIDQNYNPESENAQSGKAVAEAVSDKQDSLVSGTNIKTINNQSILGSGNITIEGGSGSSITVDQTFNPDSTNAQSGKAVAEAITKKANKPKVTTITVDTPIWTNQPTIVGDTALHRDFKKWIDDFYYCTLKSADGSALPSGQFKLMTKYNDPTTAIDQIFQLSNLFTGNSGWLSENMTIDFKEVGNSWKMRNGGVSSVECSEKVLNREIYVSGYFSASAGGTTYFQYFPNINNCETYSNMPAYSYGGGVFKLFLAISIDPNTQKMALASAVFKVKALNSIMICDGCYTARTFLKRADISTNKGVKNFCSDNSTLGTLIKNDGTAITLDDITDLPFFIYGADHGAILNGTNIMFVDEV